MKLPFVHVRKLARAAIIALPTVMAGAVLLSDRPANVMWLGRDDRGMIPLGGTVVRAAVPFHGSLWSVWAEVGGGEGGWSRTIRMPSHGMEYRSMVGLHPDFYERGRSTRVRVDLRVHSTHEDTILATTILLPDAQRRYRPFVPVVARLTPWASQTITLTASVRNFGDSPVEVLWIEPRLVRMRGESP